MELFLLFLFIPMMGILLAMPLNKMIKISILILVVLLAIWKALQADFVMFFGIIILFIVGYLYTVSFIYPNADVKDWIKNQFNIK